jgi:uncharacterized protein (DUF488 family)
MPDTVWTVGTGHRSFGELLALLAEAWIESLVDVRSYPKSHLRYFSRLALAAALPKHGLSYAWLGDDLGGLRRGGYQRHMTTEVFARGLDRLEELARSRRTAVCCAEVEPERCHRRFIANALLGRGWRVVHLVRPGEHRDQTATPRQGALPLDGSM